MPIKNLSIAKSDYKQPNDKLKSIVKLMEKNNINNPLDLLPQSDFYNVKFNLVNTNSAFANGIRRILIEELPVTCLEATHENIHTTDDFLLTDVIRKNINLIPINQEFILSALKNLYITIDIFNNTNKQIDVKARDLIITKNQIDPAAPKTKHKSIIAIDKLIPDGNITIFTLSPGKQIVINDIVIESGLSKDDAAKFSLLNNVSYKPIGYKPYNNFDKTGIRSSDYDPDEFEIQFTTNGNITPKSVMTKLYNTVADRLSAIRSKVSTYKDNKSDSSFYAGDNIEVSFLDSIETYKFHTEYITLTYMIAQQCYQLDKNIKFCTPSIDRYDNEIGIIKINHPDSPSLIIKAIDDCISHCKEITSAFK